MQRVKRKNNKLEMRKRIQKQEMKKNVEGNLVQEGSCNFLDEILANIIFTEY